MMVSYDLFGNDTASWRPPLTERDGFWEGSGSGGVGSGMSVPVKLAPDVTVCKDGGNGGCNYRTVQEAVDAAPDDVGVGERRFVIHIKEGVYEERVRVPLRKRNVVFLGDGMGKTVITGSANVGLLGMTTYDTATVGEFVFVKVYLFYSPVSFWLLLLLSLFITPLPDFCFLFYLLLYFVPNEEDDNFKQIYPVGQSVFLWLCHGVMSLS